MENYFQKTLTSRAPTVAIVLDPRYKLYYFETLLKNEGSTRSTIYNKVKGHFTKVYDTYAARETEKRLHRQL